MKSAEQIADEQKLLQAVQSLAVEIGGTIDASVPWSPGLEDELSESATTYLMTNPTNAVRVLTLSIVAFRQLEWIRREYQPQDIYSPTLGT